MTTFTQPPSQSKAATITGYIFTALAALFLLFDGVMKLMKPDFVVKATVQLGYSENVIIPLGIVLTLSTLLYLFPKTSILGAILLTGYLGGAVNTHVRAGGSLFEIFFPVIFGALLWLGLYLRNPRLRALVPLSAN